MVNSSLYVHIQLPVLKQVEVVIQVLIFSQLVEESKYRYPFSAIWGIFFCIVEFA